MAAKKSAKAKKRGGEPKDAKKKRGEAKDKPKKKALAKADEKSAKASSKAKKKADEKAKKKADKRAGDEPKKLKKAAKKADAPKKRAKLPDAPLAPTSIPSVPPAEARRSLPPDRPSKPPSRNSESARPRPALVLPKSFSSADQVHLLVVDDEPEVLNLLVPHLKRRGFTVSEAEDGDQALEKILTDRPQIVLLDVMMPGLTGWEISQYVRDREELDGVRIVMATGIGEEMNAATAPLYGADAYIDKPFRLDDVERAIVDVLERIHRGELGPRANGD